jgi:hypothetical protein
MGRYLRPPASNPLTTPDVVPLNAPGVSRIPARRGDVLRRGGSVTTDKGYWHSPGVVIPRIETTGSRLPDRKEAPPLLADTPHGRFYPELDVAAQLPPWQDPSYWTLPLESVFTCSAVPWYASWSTVQTIEVENNWMYVIRGFCFEWSSIAVGDVFEFQIWAGGIVLSTFQSMRITAAVANPAYQYAIGGPQRPIPVYGVVDQNKSIQIRVRNLGPQATNGTFSKVDSDAFGSAITTNLIGWKAPLAANRDGGPLPGDVFPITDGVDFEPRFDLDAMRSDRGGSTRSI